MAIRVPTGRHLSDDSRPPRRWQATLTGAAIVICALGLRAPLTELSPVSGDIERELGVHASTIALIGSIGPFLLAAAAVGAGWISSWISPQTVAVVASVTLATAIVARSTAADGVTLTLFAGLAYVCIGVLNAVIPTLIGITFSMSAVPLITAVYAGVIAIGTSAAPIVSTLSVELGSWRFSSLVWGSLSCLAGLLLAATSLSRWRTTRAVVSPVDTAAVPVGVPRRREHAMLTMLFGAAAFNAFAMFAWLPTIVRSRFMLSAQEASGLLALYAFMAIPVALVAPVLLRSRTRFRLVATIGVIAAATGYALLLLPGAWAIAAVTIGGSGQLLFAAGLVRLADLERAANTPGISGRIQGAAFAIGALGPLAATGLMILDQSATLLCVTLGLLTAAILVPLAVMSRDPVT